MRSTVRYGSVGDSVKEIQNILTQMGYDVGPIDGQAGTRTITAISSFQRDYGLNVDGIAGNQTWTMIDAVLSGQASSSPSANVSMPASSSVSNYNEYVEPASYFGPLNNSNIKKAMIYFLIVVAGVMVIKKMRGNKFKVKN